MRITLVTEIPAPFRIPLFNALDDNPDVELDVLFLARHDPRRTYTVFEDEFRFRWRVLGGRSIRRGPHWLVLSTGVRRALRRHRPDLIVLGGWNQPAFWAALAYAAPRRVPVVTWVESTARDRRGETGLFEKAKRLLLQRSAAVLVPGAAAADYARALGVSDDRIVIAPNAVDVALFGSPPADRRSLRERLGLERATVLFVGRLDPEKGLDVLFEAVRDLDADLVVIGTGTLDSDLRAAAPGNVRFVGRVERDDLPAWYHAADIFVLPSRSEPWGMVLNEAAAAGLPIVATTAAGAASELVEDGASGFVVPPEDVPALRTALRRFVGDAQLRAVAADRSRELAARLTPEAWAEAVGNLAGDLVR